MTSKVTYRSNILWSAQLAKGLLFLAMSPSTINILVPSWEVIKINSSEHHANT